MMRLSRSLLWIALCAGAVSSAWSEVTLDTDFTNAAAQGDALYKFWEVRNEIPAYPNVGAQKPPNPHTSNCIRLLGGWSSNGVANEAEDSCIWDEAQQKYVYRIDKIIRRIDGVLTDGFKIHQLVLDNPPWCFQRGLTFSSNPGPGEYDEADRISTYGNSMPPGEPAEWNAFIRAVMTKLVETYGLAQVEQWRFRVHTEADYHPHHWSGTKQDYFDHYANTVDAVHAVVPAAKVAAHFLQPGSGTDRYGLEFVNWCAQNNVPVDFIGVTYYPFYNNANQVDLDRIYTRDLKPFVDAPGWKPHMRLEIPEYSLFTERDDDGFNMGVGTSHNPAFVAMLAKMLYEKSVLHVHNWGEKAREPIYLALDGMLGKTRFSNGRSGTPAGANNKIDGIFAVADDRTSVDALVHNFNANPAYLAAESVNLSMKVPVPAGSSYTYRIASCDRSNNPHSQFVAKYPLAGKWQSEGGWVLNRIRPDSPNQTDKNGLLGQILVDPGKTLWKQEESTFPGYQSLVWSDWTTITTTGGDASGSYLNPTIPSPSFSFQKIEFRTNVAPIGGNVPSLVAHWPLDEGAGTTTSDVAGTSGPATLLHGPTWGSDATRGTFVEFDGSDDRIATAFTYALADTDDFTWAWWAKRTAGGSDAAIMVGNRYPAGLPGENFEFIKFTPGEAEFANAEFAGSIGRYDYADVPVGGWHHYAMVKTGTSYQWYVDGVAQGAPVTQLYSESAPIPFQIGGDDDDAIAGGREGEHFTGCIDDVVLYREALSPGAVVNVMNGIYLPEIMLTTLGSPVDTTDGTVWSDGEPAHGGATYVVPSTGNLRGELGSSVFPGESLTVRAGGRFQVRAVESDVTTVGNLILEGGPGFGPGESAELAAGIGTGVTNVLDGVVSQSGATRLLTYGGSIARRLKVLSRIDGGGTLQVVGEGAIIDAAENSFAGTWEVTAGSSLVFSNAGAVGSADIHVQGGGALEILGDWSGSATLAVADSAGTEIGIGAFNWRVGVLLLEGMDLPDGIYTAADLNALGSHANFTGTGRILVGNVPPTPQVIAGWDHWNSNTAPAANVIATGITAFATATTASGSWSNSDLNNDGRGSSGDQTWGSFGGNGVPASSTTSGAGANMTAPNGVTSAQITFTMTNNGASDWELYAFHMDAIAFRPNAPRTYQLEVLAGAITHGVVFTSAPLAINQLGGTLSVDHDDHDSIAIPLAGLADSTLEPGATAVIRVSFSGGTGSGGGHHLFVDNVAFSATTEPLTAQQIWRLQHFGTIENTGTVADGFDANSDGENNLLEFATGQNPHANTRAETFATRNGASLEFRYARSTAAVDDGIQFVVEWSDTLELDSWTTTGVIDSAAPDDTENPGSPEFEERIATIPAGLGRRFVHLKITGAGNPSQPFINP